MQEYYKNGQEDTPVSLRKDENGQSIREIVPDNVQQEIYPQYRTNGSGEYPQNIQTGNYGEQQGNFAYQTKFCKFCGGKIPFDAVVCTLCGRQVEQLAGANQPQQIIIRNDNNNVNTNVVVPYGRAKNKWVAVLLCLFAGWLGAHRFYEGKIPSAILYLFTLGLFGIGSFVDLIILLCKPNPYYV